MSGRPAGGAGARGTGPGLPHTHEVRHPRRLFLHWLRAPSRVLLRRRWDIRVHEPDRVPATGPVILACNHTGWLDGPLLGVYTRRPVHSLTKAEAFAGATDPFLRAAGQIELHRLTFDVGAMRTAVRVLREDGVVGIFPEGTRGRGDFSMVQGGTAYLALVTGATIVPVAMFGVREPGAHSDALPPRGSRIDIVYGDPVSVAAEPWPRTRARVHEVTDELAIGLRAFVADAAARTGRTLPGPLPAGDKENAVAREVAEKEHHD